MTERFQSDGPVVAWILKHVRRDLRVALPLGLTAPRDFKTRLSSLALRGAMRRRSDEI